MVSDTVSKTPPDTSHFIEKWLPKKLQSLEKELHVECVIGGKDNEQLIGQPEADGWRGSTFLVMMMMMFMTLT